MRIMNFTSQLPASLAAVPVHMFGITLAGYPGVQLLDALAAKLRPGWGVLFTPIRRVSGPASRGGRRPKDAAEEVWRGAQKDATPVELLTCKLLL